MLRIHVSMRFTDQWVKRTRHIGITSLTRLFRYQFAFERRTIPASEVRR